MQTSHLDIPEPLRIIEQGGERILPVVFCGENRFPEYLSYQRRVFTHLEIPINHVVTDFSAAFTARRSMNSSPLLMPVTTT
jgi:hypothetical protein